MKVFVSYNHRQAHWVWDRLKPCLEAGGSEVLIDGNRFRAGRTVIAQMDVVQDQADVHVLVLSEDYVKSRYCLHEMHRAIAKDPGFERRVVIPVLLDACLLPEKIRCPDVAYVDLRNELDEHQWHLLMQGCGAELGESPSSWLRAKNEIIRWLGRKQSVNLVVGPGVKWRPLVEHVRQTAVKDLKYLDLEDPAIASRRGLLQQILMAWGVQAELPAPPEDLVSFGHHVRKLSLLPLVLAHFDLVPHRHKEYDVDLFAALRHLIMIKKKLVLLIQSRTPLTALLPSTHPLSAIEVMTTELKGRP
jgi:hypothetical protein